MIGTLLLTLSLHEQVEVFLFRQRCDYVSTLNAYLKDNNPDNRKKVRSHNAELDGSKPNPRAGVPIHPVRAE